MNHSRSMAKQEAKERRATHLRGAGKALAAVSLVLAGGCGPAASDHATASSLASGPTFATIDVPGAGFTLALDINDAGQIVGESLTSLGARNGFLLSNGTLTTIAVPGAVATRAIGINASGDVVGDYTVSGQGNGNVHGFLLRNGALTTIDFPNADGTTAEGINKNGDIVGYYEDKKGMHGFLLSAGAFTSIDFPGADAFTQAWKITNGGEIAGRYEGGDSKYHVFTLSAGKFSSVPDVPGALQISPGNYDEDGGMNDLGDIVSTYCNATPCTGFGTLLNGQGNVQGFLLSGGVFTTIDVPAAAATEPQGINNNGAIVGFYADTSSVVHGFLRTP